MSGLIGPVEAVLDRRLQAASDAPVVVALSGGGDSVALTLVTAMWAKAHGRRLVVLHVDHGINPASQGWGQSCADLAGRLGAEFQILAWTGPKPATGLPAAARLARHRLLADAARAAGASVILMGHTADDLCESAMMRQAGSSVPDAREWAPSPVWPQGRGLFLLRPLLGILRSDLRAWLTARGEPWIDDPANEDQRFARSRARRETPPVGRATLVHCQVEGLSDLAAQVAEDHGLSLSRELLRAAPLADAKALVGVACLCAAGTTRPARGDRLDRLTHALMGQQPVVATLGGARIEADAAQVRWMRQASEIARSGTALLSLESGEIGVWDGRFEITSLEAIRVGPLAGRMGRLAPNTRAKLARIPVAARGGLPVLIGPPVLCPTLEPVPGLVFNALSRTRLLHACGVIDREIGSESRVR